MSRLMHCASETITNRKLGSQQLLGLCLLGEQVLSWTLHPGVEVPGSLQKGWSLGIAEV